MKQQRDNEAYESLAKATPRDENHLIDEDQGKKGVPLDLDTQANEGDCMKKVVSQIDT